ncbi:hypothetical protein KEJ45_02155 [Candidatus Bathyarchaeota archaeon]|nr:hypothetical protein [Candidatus Bathyarchaeota archaeon]
MDWKSKLNIEDTKMFASFLFYVVAGIICLVVLATDLALVHIGLIGIISLVTAYGLFKKRIWALWSLFVLFFMANAFAISVLYYTMGRDLLVDLAIIVYLILTWASTVYVAARRKKLQP